MRRLADDLGNRTDSEEEEEQVEGVLEEESDDDLIGATRAKGKQKLENDDDQAGFIVQTAFDAYFTHAKAASKTSSNVFSSLVPPLAADEYVAAIDSASKGAARLKPIQSSITLDSSRELLFSRFMRELAEGFNLLMYGFGSKRRMLNQFATEFCSKAGHVVVANGFQPEFSLKDLLASIENVPGIVSVDIPSSTPENQSKRIYDFFASARLHLYLIIHNIDSAPLRTSKAKSCLSLLALNPYIHIIASVDHINAPLIWSTSESTTRKPSDVLSSGSSTTPSRGFAWLWHDLTTLASYDFELSYIDRTSISSAHGGGARKKADIIGATQGLTGMSETAALHVLASVTQKAQKLFAFLGTRQLENIAEVEGDQRDLKEFGMVYDTLFNAARDNFIATNDTAFRSLLAEFRDHRLVLSEQGTGGMGEILWIPLRKERLTSVLSSLHAESADT